MPPLPLLAAAVSDSTLRRASPPSGPQFVWGIYPAALRYLQTKAERPLTSLQLRWVVHNFAAACRVLDSCLPTPNHSTIPTKHSPLCCSFLINLLACPALLLGTTLPLLLLKACKSSSRSRSSSGGVDGDAGEQERIQAHALPGSGKAPAAGGTDGNPAAAGSKSSAAEWESTLAEPLLAAEGHTDLEAASNATLALAPAPAGPSPAAIGVPIAAEPPQQHQLPRTAAQHGPTWRQQVLVLLGTTCFLTALFMCQVFSLLFTTVSRAPLPAICLPCLQQTGAVMG